jgi:hypothetical protein
MAMFQRSTLSLAPAWTGINRTQHASAAMNAEEARFEL